MASENALQKQKREAEVGLANAPLKKKIGFFSAIVIVIGSVMGAGMFFKAKTVLANSQGSILFSIFCWLLTVFAIILMAMALIEISSARNDNLSLIGWCQTFNSRVIYKACRNFMTYIYVPLSYFFLPIYFIMSIQDGIAALAGSAQIGGNGYDWILTTIIIIAVSSYFIVVCGLSSKIGNIQNWMITSVNFIPVFIAIVVGAIGIAQIGGIAGGQAGVNAGLIDTPKYDFVNFIPSEGGLSSAFQSMSPGFGLFIGAGAIFFAYDGFYVTAGIQTEMKEPKKTPYALLYGLLAITVVYVTVAVMMSFSSTDGSPFGMKWIFVRNNILWLYAIFQILIGVGVLSILNGFGMWTPRFFEDLMKANELPFSTKYVDKLNSHHPKVGVVYNLVISIPFIILFCVIGSLGYVNSGDYGVADYGDAITRLYSFADLIATWSSVGAFTFILFPIIGALNNRRTNIVRVEKTKTLVPSAIGCIILITPTIFMTYFVSIADLFLLFRISVPTDAAEYQSYLVDTLIPRIMIVVVLGLYLIGTFLPTFIEDRIMIKKYGSVENGEGHKLEEVARIKDIPLKDVIFNNLKTTKRFTLNKWEQGVLNKHALSEKEIEEIISHNNSDQ